MKKWKTITSSRNRNAFKALWLYRREMRQMMSDVIKGKHRLSFLTLLMGVFTLIYMISPIDLVPDFIPVAGWLDDGFLLFQLLKRLLMETHRYTAIAHQKKNAIVVIS